MGLIFRKRVRVGRSGRTWVNLSKSGASVSRKLGDRVTVNSRGRVTIRIAPGISWRIGR
jgi:hypothetical protein